MGFDVDKLPITKLAYQLFVQQQKGVLLGNDPATDDIMGFNCPKNLATTRTQRTWFDVSSNLNNVKIEGNIKTDFKIHRTAPDGECGYHSYLFGIYSNIAGGKYLPSTAPDLPMKLLDLCTLVAGDNGRPIPAAQITLNADNSRNLEKLYFDGLEGVIGSLSSADSAARPELASKANFDEWKSSPKGKSAALLNVHGIRGIKTLDDKGYLNIKFEKHVLQRLKFLTYNNIIQKSINFLPVGGDGKLKLEKRAAEEPSTSLQTLMQSLIAKITDINIKILKTHSVRQGWVEVFGNPDTAGAPDAQASGLDGDSWGKSRSDDTGSTYNGVGPLVSSYYMTKASESQVEFEIRQFEEAGKLGPIDLGWRGSDATGSYPVYVDLSGLKTQSKSVADPQGMKPFEKNFMETQNIIELNKIAKAIDDEVNKIIAAGLGMSVAELVVQPFNELMKEWYKKVLEVQTELDQPDLINAEKKEVVREKLEWITQFCSPQKTTFTSFYKLLVSDGGNEVCTSPGWYDIDIGQQFYYAFRTPQCYMTCEPEGMWRSVGYNNIKKLSAEISSFTISNEAIIGSNGSKEQIYPVMLLNNANHFSAMTTTRNSPLDKIFSFDAGAAGADAGAGAGAGAAAASDAGAGAADAGAAGAGAATVWKNWHTKIINDIIDTQFVRDGVDPENNYSSEFYGTVLKNNENTLSFVDNAGRSHLININSEFANGVGIGEPIHIGNPIMTPQAFVDALLRRMIAKKAEREMADPAKGAAITADSLKNALEGLQTQEKEKLRERREKLEKKEAATAAAIAAAAGALAAEAAEQEPESPQKSAVKQIREAKKEQDEKRKKDIPPNISEIFYQNDKPFEAPNTPGSKIFYISYLDTKTKALHPTGHQLGTLQDYADCLYNRVVTVAIEINYIEAMKVAEDASEAKKTLAKIVNKVKTASKKIASTKYNPLTKPDYVKAAFDKFKEMDTDVFHLEIDEWLRVINGNYGTKNLFEKPVNNDKVGTTQEDNSTMSERASDAIFQNREEYKNPFRNNYEKSEKSGKVDSQNNFITHINSPNEIAYYKKINISKSLDWMGSTSATPFNFFIETTTNKDNVYKGGGLTIMLLKELIPSTTTAWWDVNLQELKIGKEFAKKLHSFKAATASVLQASNEPLITRFNIKPKLVALMASTSKDYNIPEPIPVLYNLKVNGINTDFAISESKLRDTYHYVYDQESHVYPSLNNAINAEYLAHKFMSRNDNDSSTEGLIETKKFLFPAKFAKEDTQSASSKAIEDRYKQSNIEDKIKEGEIKRLKREASSTESVASINSNTRERNLVSFHKMNNALISILDSNITSEGNNYKGNTKPAVRTNIPDLVLSPPPPYKKIDRFPFPPHLFQEFNSTNDEDLLFNENVMFVKKMARPEQNRLGKIFLKENENVFESTQCLATGDGCVNYQEDISILLKIPRSSIISDTTYNASTEVIQERNTLVNSLRKGARKSAAGLGCIAWMALSPPLWVGGAVWGGGYGLKKTSRDCSSWWKRADYSW